MQSTDRQYSRCFMYNTQNTVSSTFCTAHKSGFEDQPTKPGIYINSCQESWICLSRVFSTKKRSCRQDGNTSWYCAVRGDETSRPGLELFLHNPTRLCREMRDFGIILCTVRVRCIICYRTIYIRRSIYLYRAGFPSHNAFGSYFTVVSPV